MRVAYFDCFSGVSGNMTLGALIALGADPGRIAAEVRKLDPGGFELQVGPVRRGPIGATHVEVKVERARASHGHGSHAHRGWREIRGMIEGAPLAPRVRELSLRIFRRLAEAEAKVHLRDVEEVRFHEVGGVDAIVDIVGSCAGLESLGVTRVECSPLPLGPGRVASDHGDLPLPAPGTAELLAGAPVYGVNERFELVTPTGAAIVTGLAAAFGSLPAMRVLGVGHGAGDDRATRLPNVLRVWLGETDGPLDFDSVCVLESHIDDLNPEIYGYLIDRLTAAGALDVALMPIQMKKGRPGTALRVIAREADREALARTIFAESSTLGVRVTRAERMLLERRVESVDTPYGPIPIKIAGEPGGAPRFHPEYEACRRVAESLGIPLREVQEAALGAARARFR
jgi:uncharacterized protein (TIGR00299 family) protein